MNELIKQKVDQIAECIFEKIQKTMNRIFMAYIPASSEYYCSCFILRGTRKVKSMK